MRMETDLRLPVGRFAPSQENCMNKTMKAAVVRAFGQPLVIEEVAVPQVGAGQVLVKIAACGVCHTCLLYTSRCV